MKRIPILCCSIHSFHSSIMNTSHAYSHKCLRTGNFFQSFRPIVDYIFPVSLKIISPQPGLIPFTSIVPHHRFTMGSSHYYSILLRSLFISFDSIKRCCTLMHRRPYRISSQTQQQFKYFRIGFRPYMIRDGTRLKRPTTPRHQPPVLIIEKYSAIFY